MGTDIRKTRTCEKCKTVVPLDKVRLYPKSQDKNILLCENCCQSMKEVKSNLLEGKSKAVVNTPRASPLTDLSQKSVPKMKFDPKKNVSQRTIGSLPAPEYLRYRCTRCNYLFKVDNSKIGVTTNLHCPYCGKADRIESVEA